MKQQMNVNFLDLSFDELSIIIGNSLTEEALGSKPLKDSEKMEVGKNWFAANLGKIKELVCNNEIIQQQVFKEGNKERNLLYAAVIDVISSYYGSLPVSALSAMIINYGLGKLCDQFE